MAKAKKVKKAKRKNIRLYAIGSEVAADDHGYKIGEFVDFDEVQARVDKMETDGSWPESYDAVAFVDGKSYTLTDTWNEDEEQVEEPKLAKKLMEVTRHEEDDEFDDLDDGDLVELR